MGEKIYPNLPHLPTAYLNINEIGGSEGVGIKPIQHGKHLTPSPRLQLPSSTFCPIAYLLS
jgi:hypothetical protein